MKYEIQNRFTGGAAQLTAEINCAEDAPRSLKLGMAVRWAIKHGACLADADLADANLAGADLAGAYLADADLADADLAGANLAGANLADAYLADAYLASADLAGANLAGANLADAYLADAYLAEASLAEANLAGANLAGANLAGANLAGANLADANLADANLADARLTDANLAGANLADAAARLSILPEGNLIGYKKVQGRIVKIRIPADARRSNATGRKCRAEYADVLEVEGGGSVTSNGMGHGKATYTAGERVHADKWDACRWNECSHGIHFFITREEAEEYPVGRPLTQGDKRGKQP